MNGIKACGPIQLTGTWDGGFGGNQLFFQSIDANVQRMSITFDARRILWWYVAREFMEMDCRVEWTSATECTFHPIGLRKIPRPWWERLLFHLARLWTW